MSTTTTLEDLRAAFPNWTIWQSSADRLWATRNQRLTDVQLQHGLSHTIDADDAQQLVALLRQEEELAAGLLRP
ncbi:hypothetical protein GCM10010116_24150 [Microbispora rosea subsp. aerata]|nr:hypothetical protein [Microbispora rosea]GGO12029.1 hypothetical protein GCM10010116_24150 [Microbispora rosea subsp. aerata]GIH55656.1 hypothetical protein Mro02_25700 [Microbispora rosea subsp. aerata]GLJ86046.1 hypothetical protein GCM10017588_47790 [Microbispora rosea subsp. aerata]